MSVGGWGGRTVPLVVVAVLLLVLPSVDGVAADEVEEANEDEVDVAAVAFAVRWRVTGGRCCCRRALAKCSSEARRIRVIRVANSSLS